jgi:hypothetical protein
MSNKFRAFIPQKLVRVYKFLSEIHIKKPILNKKLNQDLIDSLKDDINCLRNYTGKDFKNWCL